jgi:hypothetical protein
LSGRDRDRTRLGTKAGTESPSAVAWNRGGYLAFCLAFLRDELSRPIFRNDRNEGISKTYSSGCLQVLWNQRESSRRTALRNQMILQRDVAQDDNYQGQFRQAGGRSAQPSARVERAGCWDDRGSFVSREGPRAAVPLRTGQGSSITQQQGDVWRMEWRQWSKYGTEDELQRSPRSREERRPGGLHINLSGLVGSAVARVR